MRGAEEAGDLVIVQRPPLARAEGRVQLYAAHGFAHERQHGMPHGGEQALDLVVAPLGDGQAHQPFFQHLQPRGAGGEVERATPAARVSASEASGVPSTRAM